MFDWRVLGGVAVAVGMLGVILGIFVALPLMLADAGVHVDWGVVAGLIINLLVAAGTFAAAGTAVWVATTDRRERQRERDADDATQARLLIVEAYCQENPLELQIKVTNNGARAIVALTFVQIEVEATILTCSQQLARSRSSLHRRPAWPAAPPTRQRVGLRYRSACLANCPSLGVRRCPRRHGGVRGARWPPER